MWRSSLGDDSRNSSSNVASVAIVILVLLALFAGYMFFGGLYQRNRALKHPGYNLVPWTKL